jgi:hypothetical protein
MRSITILMMLTAAFAMSSCGKSLSKLTDAQKTTLSDTLESAGRAPKSVPGGSPINKLDGRFAALNWIASAPKSSDQARTSMEGRISDAKDQCAIARQDLDTGSIGSGMSIGNAASMKMNLKVDGAKCPINLDLNLAGSASSDGNSGELSFGIKYSVLDADFAKLNDVDSMDISGKMKMSGEMSETSAKMSMSLDISGKVHSQAQGDVSATLSGDMSVKADKTSSSTSGEVKATFEFKDFTAELKQKIDGEKNTYFINGDEVTEVEFQTYFEKAGVPAKVGTSTHSTPTHSAPTGYTGRR